LLITAKPALTESLGILGVSVVLGLAATLLTPNKSLHCRRLTLALAISEEAT
jgi:hypothetical protein